MKEKTKKKAIVTAMIAALLGGSVLPVAADVTGTDGTAAAGSVQQPCNGHFAKWAQALGLTSAQQAQIQTIMQAARQNNAPLRQQLAASRQQIQQLIQSGTPDEATIKNILAGDDDIRAKLIVSRAQTRSQIQAILTPDQQALAQKLRQIFKPHWRH